jgi:hypothetical protein
VKYSVDIPPYYNYIPREFIIVQLNLLFVTEQARHAAAMELPASLTIA